MTNMTILDKKKEAWKGLFFVKSGMDGTRTALFHLELSVTLSAFYNIINFPLFNLVANLTQKTLLFKELIVCLDFVRV